MQLSTNGSEIRISATGIGCDESTIVLDVAEAEEILQKLPNLLRIAYDRRLSELIDQQKSIMNELELLAPKCGCSNGRRCQTCDGAGRIWERQRS